MTATRHGTVKWFNDERGYGFITEDETGKEFFVHHKNINMTGRRMLFVSDSVTFEIGPDSNGRPQAVNVIKHRQ